MNLEGLLTRWRVSRSPGLADELQRASQGEPPEFTALWRATARERGEAAFEALAQWPDDPRLTVLLVKCLHAARWSGSGARDLWVKITGRLVTLRDPRAIAALREAADHPHFQGIAHTKWMQALLRQTADALAAACKGLPEADPSPWFARTGAAPTRQATVEQVWASPDDDATRLVVADALLERGDPWGEFITLGFKLAARRNDRQDLEARAATLIHKHARVFGGPIAFIATREQWKFEKGFLTEVCANRALVARRRWEEAAAAPHWATVRAVSLDEQHAPRWWLTALLKNPATAGLRSLVAPSVELARAGRGEPWTIAWLGDDLSGVGWLTAFLRGLDAAERARLQIAKRVGGGGRAVIAQTLQKIA